MTVKPPERPLLPDVFSQDPEVQRLYEAFNRLGGQLMTTIDAAIKFSAANPAAQRERHNARRHLLQAGQHAMCAIGFNRKPT